MRRQRNLLGPQGMGGMVSLWGASSLIKSVQAVTVSITGSNTSGTTAINSVDTASTMLLPAGFTSAGTTGYATYTLPSVTLTNATTLTATKLAGDATVAPNAYGINVLEFSSGIIKSIQYVSWTYVGTTSGDTFSINSVNTSKSVLVLLGWMSNGGTWQGRFVFPRVYFNSATQLGITAFQDPYGSGYDSYPRVMVVEFF